MAINLTYTSGNAVSITTSETSLAVDGGSTSLQTLTDAGLYTLFLDCVTNMVKGDEYTWKVYEKCHGSGTKRVIMQGKLLGAQSEPLVLPNLLLGLGWDITLQQVSASARAFAWSIRRVS